MPGEVLAKSAKNGSDVDDGPPEPRVPEDESLVVDDQLGAEILLGEPIPILREPGVALHGTLRPELGPAQPDGCDFGFLAHLEPKPANRERVRRRREAEIDVRAVLELGRPLFPDQSPPSSNGSRGSPPAKATSTSTSWVTHIGLASTR